MNTFRFPATILETFRFPATILETVRDELARLGVEISEPSQFGTVSDDPTCTPVGQPGGHYCKISLPVGWRVEGSWYEYAIIDGDGYVIARVSFAVCGWGVDDVKLEKAGVLYVNSRVDGARRMLATYAADMSLSGMPTEIDNNLRDEVGPVADSLRAELALLKMRAVC